VNVKLGNIRYQVLAIMVCDHLVASCRRRAHALVTNLLVDPVQVVWNLRIHSGIVGSGTPSTPGHYSWRNRKEFINWKGHNAFIITNL